MVIGGSTGITTTGPITANQLKTTYESGGTRYYDSVADVGSDGSITLYDPLKSAVGILKQNEKDLTTADTTWREFLFANTATDFTTKNEEATKTQRIIGLTDNTHTYFRMLSPALVSGASTTNYVAYQIFIPANPTNTNGLASFEIGVQSGSRVTHGYRPGSGYAFTIQKFGPNKNITEELFTIQESTGDVIFSDRMKATLGIKDILWQNQNPDTAFAAQDVNIDLTNYSEIEVEFLTYTSYPNIIRQGFFIGNAEVNYATATMTNFYFRQVTATTSKVTFGQGFSCPEGNFNNKTYNNSILVPYRIWGWNPPVYISS